MQINLIIFSRDAVSLAGLVAIVDRYDRVQLIGCGDIHSDGSIGPMDQSRPHVIILGGLDSKNALCGSIDTVVNHYGAKRDAPKILVVSPNDDDEVIVAALRAGVNGYLTCISAAEDLLCAVQIVAAGGAAFSPVVAERFRRYFATVSELPALVPDLECLTSREFQVLELLAVGLPNRQIARRLFLSDKTVRNYMSRIFTKLQLHDRTAVTLWAREAGLGPPAEPVPPVAGPDRVRATAQGATPARRVGQARDVVRLR
jgi:DNA-binding NarL/FixJ family response regulator